LHLDSHENDLIKDLKRQAHSLSRGHDFIEISIYRHKS